VRHLILILGDQLDRRSAAFDGFDARVDVVWMTEPSHESTKVWVSKPRIAVFLAAMRQFAAALRAVVAAALTIADLKIATAQQAAGASSDGASAGRAAGRQ